MTAAPATPVQPGGSTPASSAVADPRVRADARFVAALAVAIVAVRLLVLPSSGLAEDMDMFAVWVNWLTTHPFGEAFNGLQLSYGPVVTWLLGLMAVLQPAFATETTSADLGVRMALKAPAVIADLGLAWLAWSHVRDRFPARPDIALAACAAVGLSPAILYVSAWWGQYDSLYALPALAAFVLAVRGRPSWAAAALALAVLTKPQAAPLVIPFAAWLLARGGPRGLLRPALAGLAVTVLLWLPFLPSGGLPAYLRAVAAYQDSLFGVLSLRAWNPWWILQTAATGGDFARDQTPILGPITFRAVGLVIAALLEVAVFRAVYRRPTADTLGWGMVAASLVAFVALTTMHERYSYPALVFLPLLFPEGRAIALWGLLTAVVTLNLVAAAPFSPEIGALLRINGWIGFIGAGLVTGAAARCMATLRRVAARPLAPA